MARVKMCKVVVEIGPGDERVDYVEWDDDNDDDKSRASMLSDHVWNEIDAYSELVYVDDSKSHGDEGFELEVIEDFPDAKG